MLWGGGSRSPNAGGMHNLGDCVQVNYNERSKVSIAKVYTILNITYPVSGYFQSIPWDAHPVPPSSSSAELRIYRTFSGQQTHNEAISQADSASLLSIARSSQAVPEI